MLLFGGGVATTLQARYAATDGSRPGRRARDLSTVMWATTVGVVLGPVLAARAGRWAAAADLPPLSGAFVVSAAGFALAALLLRLLLRPGPPSALPAAEARPTAAARPVGRSRARTLGAELRRPRARCALTSIVAGHAVMVLVMSTTPIHLVAVGEDLEVVGLVLSAHLAGMYAASPLFGWLADRSGALAVVLIAQALLVASLALVALAAGSHLGVMVGMVVLGLGWSASLIAGATLLTETVAPAARTSAQGTADTSMNLAGAGAAALGGPVLATFGHQALVLGAAVLLLPPLVSALGLVRPGRWRAQWPGRTGSGGDPVLDAP